MSGLDRALALAEAGIRVHPTRGKAPILRNPLEAASTDPKVIAEWWADNSDATPGFYPGQNRLIVVDVDEKNGVSGHASLTEAGLELPATMSYPTPSGGRHYVYSIPDGLELGPRDGFLPGVDLRRGNGNVVCYAKKPKPIAPAPDWALQDAKAAGADRAPDADVATFFARVVPGKPSKAVREALERITSTGTGHADMLEVTSTLVRLGREGHPGVGAALEAARATYSDGWPGADRAWDAAVAGSVRRFGLPPVTIPLTKAQRREIERRNAAADRPSEPPRPEPVSLTECHDAFVGWLGIDYDLDALDAVLAAAVVERMNGDPAWLLLVSGSGNAKTETVQSLAGAGAHVVSSIASEGALLSATSKGERSSDATGGLLSQIGERGVLVMKDVTSVLSGERTARGQIFAALREVYDGHWTRNVGTDGGRSLEWKGRLVVIGAVTTAWDRAHADTISAFGDRFVLVRMDSSVGRIAAGRKAIENTGSEEAMRAELAAAVAGVLEGADLSGSDPDDDEAARILAAADLVTLARTAVDTDYRGNVIDSHAPEAPTRFAKQLAQIFRGAVAIGRSRAAALALAIRVARDSMPPLRLEILEDVAANEWTPLREVVKRVDKPRSTVDRQLQALHLLGLLTVDEEVSTVGPSLRETTTWRYTLAEGVDVSSIKTPIKKKVRA